MANTKLSENYNKPNNVSIVAYNYNKIELSYSSANLTYSGSTSVNGINVNLLSATIGVTGSAGWRYVVCTDLGVVSIETIPVAEIVSNVIRYSPNPVFNNTYQGYYSTLNTSKRIIGILYFDATNITKVIAYGNGSNKNDDFWYWGSSGVINSTNDGRLQLTVAPVHQLGTNITCVDNGSGTTDASGFRITANKSGYLKINIPFVTQSNATSNVAILCNKNGVYYKLVADSNNQNAASFQTATMFSSEALVELGDYFTFYVSIAGTGAAYIRAGAEITFKEF